MWIEVNFHLSEVAKRRLFGARSPAATGGAESGTGSGRQFRQWLAKASDEAGLGLPEALFHYRNGHARPDLPRVRFGWFPGGVRLLGLGAEGVSLVRECAPGISAHLMRTSQSLVQVRMREGTCALHLTPMPRAYFAPSVVVSKDTNLRRWLELLDEAKSKGCALLELQAARELVAQCLGSGLRRQLDLLREDGGQGFADDDDEALFERRSVAGEDALGIEVRPTQARHFFAKGVNALTGEYLNRTGKPATKPLLGIVGVEFTAKAELIGPWAAGRLQSQGNGAVFLSRKERDSAAGAAAVQMGSAA